MKFDKDIKNQQVYIISSPENDGDCLVCIHNMKNNPRSILSNSSSTPEEERTAWLVEHMLDKQNDKNK